MLIEIPDDKLPKILKGVQDMCNSYLEYEDPAPGVGKTNNQFFWFEDLNSILYEQVNCKNKLIHDFDGTEDYFCTDKIETLCHLENADWVAVKVVRDFGCIRKDPYTPNPITSFYVTDDLYEFTNNLIDSEDSKNGIQIYQDTDTSEYYIQITGQLFFDKITDKPAGEDTVKVYYKEFKW